MLVTKNKTGRLRNVISFYGAFVKFNWILLSSKRDYADLVAKYRK